MAAERIIAVATPNTQHPGQWTPLAQHPSLRERGIDQINNFNRRHVLNSKPINIQHVGQNGNKLGFRN